MLAPNSTPLKIMQRISFATHILQNHLSTQEILFISNYVCLSVRNFNINYESVRNAATARRAKRFL